MSEGTGAEATSSEAGGSVAAAATAAATAATAAATAAPVAASAADPVAAGEAIDELLAAKTTTKAPRNASTQSQASQSKGPGQQEREGATPSRSN